MIDYKLKRKSKRIEKLWKGEKEKLVNIIEDEKQKTKERIKERKISVNYMKIKGGKGKEKSQKQNLVGRLIAR